MEELVVQSRGSKKYPAIDFSLIEMVSTIYISTVNKFIGRNLFGNVGDLYFIMKDTKGKSGRFLK